MNRRIPLWVTLLPLVLGVLFWAWMWRGYAAGFRADLEKAAPPGVEIEVGGFPYRLEAHIPALDAKLEGGALQGRLRVKELTVNRVPWQADRQVLNLDSSDAEIAVAALAGVSARVEAGEAQASLKLDDGRIGRLSIVWEAPRLTTGLLPVPVRAGHLEAHLRETPAEGAAGAAVGAPGAQPAQAQLVISGKDVRFGEGAPLSLALDSEVTAKGPLRDFALWARDGAVEIRSAALADATGEVARLKATLRPDGKGALHLEGEIETVCPASVRAAVAGGPPPSEKRSRKPQQIRISGRLPGGLELAPADPSKPPPPVRGQEPLCPRLR